MGMDKSKQLIRAVETRPELWKEQLKAFFTEEELRESWELVGKSLSPPTSGTVAFMRFKALSEMYMSELEKEEKITSYQSSWSEFNDLKFLTTGIKELESSQSKNGRFNIEKNKMMQYKGENISEKEGPQEPVEMIVASKLLTGNDVDLKKNSIIEISSSDEDESIKVQPPRYPQRKSKIQRRLNDNQLLENERSTSDDSCEMNICKKKPRKSASSASKGKKKPIAKSPRTLQSPPSSTMPPDVTAANQPLAILGYCLERIPEKLRMQFVLKVLSVADNFLKKGE